MNKFLNELAHDLDDYVVNCDNQIVIHLAKNHMFHSHSKLIDFHCHWIRGVRWEETEVRENPYTL